MSDRKATSDPSLVQPLLVPPPSPSRSPGTPGGSPGTPGGSPGLTSAVPLGAPPPPISLAPVTGHPLPVTSTGPMMTSLGLSVTPSPPPGSPTSIALPALPASSSAPSPDQPKSRWQAWVDGWKEWKRPVGFFSRLMHGVLNGGYQFSRWGLDGSISLLRDAAKAWKDKDPGTAIWKGLVGVVGCLAFGTSTIAFAIVKAPYYWWNLGVEALDKFFDKKVSEPDNPDHNWWWLASKAFKVAAFVLDFLFVATMIALTPIAAVAQVGAAAVGGFFGLFGASASAIITGLLNAAKGIASLIATIFTTPAVTAPVVVVTAAATPATKAVADAVENQGNALESAINKATELPASEIKAAVDPTAVRTTALAAAAATHPAPTSTSPAPIVSDTKVADHAPDTSNNLPHIRFSDV